MILWPNGSNTRPTITSPFGPRSAPVAGASTYHRGTDFVGYSTVRAIADGTVVAVGVPGGWGAGGTQVWVQHDGFLTRSMHLVAGSPVVRVKQIVRAGDPLGTMGRTGNVSGVHHHLEVVVHGIQVDPVPFITNRLAAPTGGGVKPGPAEKPQPAMKPEEDLTMKRLMLIDPNVDGAWYVVDYLAGTAVRLRNGYQLDRCREDRMRGELIELSGPQPVAATEHLTIING